ncbi:MAG: eL32 family ribosomal protein [Candidatus Nanoarchaeia archaeon]
MKFLRKDWYKKPRFKRKKKQKWRYPIGLHNKLRLGKIGRGKKPRIGYSNNKQDRNKINGLQPVRVDNIKQLDNINKEQGIIVGKVGKRKKQLIIKKAQEKKLNILNQKHATK